MRARLLTSALCLLGAIALGAAVAGVGCSSSAQATDAGTAADTGAVTEAGPATDAQGDAQSGPCTRQTDCAAPKACFARSCGITPTCQSIDTVEQAVCACDGVTYPNTAAAFAAGQFSYTLGACGDGGPRDASFPDTSTDASPLDGSPSDAAAPPHTVLVSGASEVHALAVTPGGIFYKDFAAVYAAPLAGGTATRLATAFSGELAVDATNAYWSDGSGNVFAVPVGGGAVTTVVGAAVGVTPGLAIDATHAYFVGPTRADVSRIPLGGGAAEAVASGACPGPIALDGTSVYFVQGCTAQQTLDSAPRAGGAPTTLMTGVGASALAVAGGYAYVGGAGIRRVPVGGGATETLVAAAVRVGAIATDGVNVYYTTGKDVRRVPAAGGTDVLMARGNVFAGRVAVDTTRLYFSADNFIAAVPL